MAYVGGFLGTFRLLHRDANDNNIAELTEKTAAEFGIVAVNSTPNTDPQKMPKVKKRLSTVLQEDDKLVLVGKPNVTGLTFDVDQFTWDLRIPVTFRNKRSGVRYEKTLEYVDFTDIIKAAGDQTAALGWYDLLEYVVPAQSEMKLGHDVQDVRVDSALNLAWDTNKA